MVTNFSLRSCIAQNSSVNSTMRHQIVVWTACHNQDTWMDFLQCGFDNALQNSHFVLTSCHYQNRRKAIHEFDLNSTKFRQFAIPIVWTSRYNPNKVRIRLRQVEQNWEFFPVPHMDIIFHKFELCTIVRRILGEFCMFEIGCGRGIEVIWDRDKR